jgi:hypothetical protein
MLLLQPAEMGSCRKWQNHLHSPISGWLEISLLCDAALVIRGLLFGVLPGPVKMFVVIAAALSVIRMCLCLLMLRTRMIISFLGFRRSVPGLRRRIVCV